MKLNKLYLTCLSIMLLTLTACNKKDQDFLYKDELVSISLNGYNASNEELIVKLDTINFPASLRPNSSFNSTNAYTLVPTENQIKLTVKEKASGKLILEKELKKEDRAIKLNFIYIDGKIGPMPEKPAVEEGKIKLIYMFQPTITNYTEPVDFVVGKYYSTPKVFEELSRAKNVKPYEFCPAITLPTFSTARQEYNGVMTAVSFVVRIYKAGTDIPYTDGTEYTWNALSSTAPKPVASTPSSKLYIFSEGPVGNIMRFFTRLDQ
ncbi:hypothetical protein SAMN05421820_101574 [Pedobacter steynii]|uniref:DUF4843 domain-containing protein n=1 Tax=Pedobacter steynii TaxID=430522 RepID=A0A1G9KG72_9SPHI|nr:hypothetical protein [Pedobacter steynii]NQX38546.1 hypothetical protein [Pedobacter steynii]SDL48890.1 hypothetical protein SAMN05421820_101574 [Pedobacter steynii]